MGQIIKNIKNNRKLQIFFLLIIVGFSFLLFVYFRANPVLPQLTIYFLDDVRLPERGERVLIFAPHPDDETIAAGGYIIESKKRDAKVYLVLITDGNKHNLRDLRFAEFITATSVLGVPVENLVFLEYPDSLLARENLVELEKVFSQQIELYQPDIIIYPHPEDNHQDHSTTGMVLEKILDEKIIRFQYLENIMELEELIKEEVLEEYSELEKYIKGITGYKYIVHHRSFPHPKKYAPDYYILPPLDLITLEGGWEKLMFSENTKEKKEIALRSYLSQLKNPLLRNLLLASIRENEIFAVYCRPQTT